MCGCGFDCGNRRAECGEWDTISAEEVIRRVELYFAGGAVDYLTAEQAAAVAQFVPLA